MDLYWSEIWQQTIQQLRHRTRRITKSTLKYYCTRMHTNTGLNGNWLRSAFVHYNLSKQNNSEIISYRQWVTSLSGQLVTAIITSSVSCSYRIRSSSHSLLTVHGWPHAPPQPDTRQTTEVNRRWTTNLIALKVVTVIATRRFIDPMMLLLNVWICLTAYLWSMLSRDVEEIFC